MTRDKVSVIIVTHNSLPALRDCLSSLKRAMSAIDYELVVVDNSSTDSSAQVVRENCPQAKVILNPANLGFASACNVGAKETSGKLLLFLNPDVRLDPDAVECLLAAFNSIHKPGAIGARMRFPDGSFQATCRRFPSIYNMVLSRGSVLSRLFWKNNLYTLPDYQETTAVPALAATVMLIRRSLFSLLSGFDERFFMFMEDTDLCRRLRALGYANLFVPSAGAIHDWGCGSDAGRIRRIWYHHNSVWKYFLKHLPNGFSLILLPLMLVLNFLLAVIIPGPSQIKRK